MCVCARAMSICVRENLFLHFLIFVWPRGVIKAFDKKGPRACNFSVKYKDDPNWWTHSLKESLLREGYEKGKHLFLLGLPSRDPALLFY